MLCNRIGFWWKEHLHSGVVWVTLEILCFGVFAFKNDISPYNRLHIPFILRHIPLTKMIIFTYPYIPYIIQLINNLKIETILYDIINKQWILLTSRNDSQHSNRNGNNADKIWETLPSMEMVRRRAAAAVVVG